MMKTLIACLAAGAVAGTAFAKLPAPAPLTDAQKAEAAEKKKASDAKEADLLAKAQDKSVAHYKKSSGAAAQKTAAPAPAKKK